MNTSMKRACSLALVAGLVTATGACEDLLQVRNPNIIDAGTVDPVDNAETFSRSAWTSFARSYGDHVVYTGWFSNEVWVGDTFPTRNEFGRRAVDARNVTYNNDVYQPLAQALAQSEDAAEIAQAAESDPDYGRARLASGFSLVLMGEGYCRGTLKDGQDYGPALTWREVLGKAIDRFDAVIAATAGTTGAEGVGYGQAALVGAARAHLQLGNHAEAIGYAAQVQEGFDLELSYVDQAGARVRLGNRAFQFSLGGTRESLVVPPHYREMGVLVEGGEAVTTGDPRIPYFDGGMDAQDETLHFWNQAKYPTWSSPMRLASHLEARYIIAEAEYHQGNPGPALTLIEERRSAGEQTPFTGSGDAVLAELMAQRSRDFWLEAKRMGDLRRNPGYVPNVLEAGADYYKDVQDGLVHDQSCWPMPFQEYNANPYVDAD
jgi:starch-binding outer membrane protein, SusD/RagB family